MVTLVIRGSTENIMDDIERAIDDGVNTYKALTRCRKVVAGAGACEIELGRRLLGFADTIPGLEQYAVREYAHAYEVVLKALSENAGEKATEIIAQLYANHQNGQINHGFVTTEKLNPVVCDAVEANILDLHGAKKWAITFATTAACTVLRVDQVKFLPFSLLLVRKSVFNLVSFSDFRSSCQGPRADQSPAIHAPLMKTNKNREF